MAAVGSGRSFGKSQFWSFVFASRGEFIATAVCSHGDKNSLTRTHEKHFLECLCLMLSPWEHAPVAIRFAFAPIAIKLEGWLQITITR